MKFELPPTIYSPEQVEALIARLQFFMVQVRQQAVKRLLKVAGATAVTQSLDSELQDVITRWHPEGELTVTSLEELSKHLDEMLQKTPVVHVMMAAPPTDELKRKVVAWLRQNLRPDLLVDFGFNRNIVGGLVVRTTNRIYDYSFRKAVLGKRDRIPELLKGVPAKSTVAVTPAQPANPTPASASIAPAKKPETVTNPAAKSGASDV